MGNYEELKAAVASVIKTNGNQEITGQVLQNTLTTLISQVGANATFAGIATPETAPGTPDQNVFYIAGQSGVYANFGGYEVIKNVVVFNNVGGKWVATELNLLSSDFGDSVVYDMAYSGYLPVDLGHLYSHSGGTGHYVASSAWDAVTLRIYNPTGKLELVGANIAANAGFVFFDDTKIKSTTIGSNQTGVIPAGAKLCVINLRKADNPDGYANLRVRQYASGADRNEVSVLNQSVLEVFSDTYNMAVKFDDQDITPEPIIGQWFDSDIPAMVVNEYYKCYKLDVSGYVGKVLHGYTYTSGTRWSCAMTDENNVVLAKFNYRTTDDRQSAIVDRMFYIGSGVKYLYINCSVSYMGAFIKTTKRELNTNKVDISPVNIKMRDVATYIGEPFVIPNHYGELSGGASDNGNIKPSNNFDLVVIKLLSSKPIIVEGATCKFYLFYNSGDLKNETYLGYNKTGDYIIGAQYVALLFEKSTGSNGLNYNQIRIVQDGTIIKIDDVVKKTELEPIAQTSDTPGYFIYPDGMPRENASFHYTQFDIADTNRIYLVSSGIGGNTNISYVYYYNSAGVMLGSQFPIITPFGGSDNLVDGQLQIPAGTAYILVNANNANTPVLKWKYKGEYYDLGQMETDIENIKGGKKLIKLHIYDTEPGRNENAFYVRAKYNDTKDILLLYYINLNTLLSPKTAYIGANTLSDADLMASANIVSNHLDSTAPLFQSSLYWHLYAQHGYVIPIVPNTVGLTTADIGALWKDQLDRQYNIGNVVGSSIYLLPVITRGTEGNDTRGWKTPNNPVITALTHVSGGTVTTPITVASQSTTQLRPIMKHENRKFYIDGRELTEPGDYEGDDFTVSESQTGYDPASITTWFPTPGAIGTPDLTGAVEMARFTWSYNFKGAQCCVNTTIDIRRKVECQSYGATQQQTFVDTGNYKAMFMIPKAKPQDGVNLEKPFNSPALSSTSYVFFRNTTYLQDVDKPIDRLIAMLHNPNDNTYLVGMAAGLSLVSGETIPAKRNANIPIAPNANDAHYRLGSFSPSNNNKFYIAAINTSPFADDGYNLPNTYFKEINYYISYFDPAANPGQLYWYKDGNSYIIYSHCQSVQSRVPLTLPDFMEGLNVEIVEQTDNAVLLTDTVQNGKLFVSYNTDDANYLVLRTK